MYPLRVIHRIIHRERPPRRRLYRKQPLNQLWENSPDGNIATPEEVIYSVLTNYDTDSEWVKPYLTENLQKELSSGGVMELMGLEGDLEGLVFQAGSTSSDPNLAYVEVALQVSGEQVYRVFTLIRNEAGWKIDTIETLEPE